LLLFSILSWKVGRCGGAGFFAHAKNPVLSARLECYPVFAHRQSTFISIYFINSSKIMHSFLALAILRPVVAPALQRHCTVRTSVSSRRLGLHVRRLKFHTSFAQSSAELAQSIILFTSHRILSVATDRTRFSSRVELHQPPAGTTPPSAAGVVEKFQIFFSVNVSSDFGSSLIVQSFIIVVAFCKALNTVSLSPKLPVATHRSSSSITHRRSSAKIISCDSKSVLVTESALPLFLKDRCHIALI
jgi:hypothetical protein